MPAVVPKYASPRYGMRNFRHTLRFLATHTSFTAAAVFTLAIGLGANTALFGLLNLALRPLEIPHPEQLVSIAAETRGDDSGGFQYTFSLESLYDLQRRVTSLSHVFGVMPRVGGLSSEGKAAQFFFVAVSDNYFAAMGIGPHLGTLFSRQSGSPAAIVLGHTFWMKHFGGDPAVIGRRVRVNGHPAVVTGVVPEGFRGTYLAVELDGYMSVEDLGVIDPDVKRWLYHNRKPRPMQLFGRLQPGVSVDVAEKEFNALLQALGREYPDTDGGLTARVVPEPLARPLPLKAVTQAIPVVRSLALIIAGLVLLIACLNVANLLLVRATARQRELAVRSALGASAGQLIWQMVLEGLVIAGLGGAAGVLVGHIVTRAVLERLDLGADLPIAIHVNFDLRVFTYSLIATMVTGIAISLWPAWRASRADARGALHDGGRSQSDSRDRQRLRSVLVVGQVAGSLALLTVAALFAQTLAAAKNIDLGFDADHLVTVRLDARQVGYDDERAEAFYDELLRRVRSWGDVASASLAFNVPMNYLANGGTLHIEGQPTPPGAQPPASFLNHVGHELLRHDADSHRQGSRVHARRGARDSHDAAAGDRQRGDGRAILARSGSDRQAAPRVRTDRTAARSGRRRAQQQVRAGVREHSALRLSAPGTNAQAAHAVRAGPRRPVAAGAAPGTRNRRPGARPADRRSQDGPALAEWHLRILHLRARRHSGGRHGDPRPGACAGRCVRRRLVRRESANARGRHPHGPRCEAR